MTERDNQALLDAALADTFPCSDPVAVGHCEHPGVPSQERDASAAADASRRPSVELEQAARRLGIEHWELKQLRELNPDDDSSIAAAAGRLRLRIT
jgi:hypothetical protein